jgi:hypothetical protein
VRGLVDRQPPRQRPSLARERLFAAELEGTHDLVAARPLQPRDLEMSSTAADVAEELAAEARAHPLARGQLGVHLAEAAPAGPAAVAALAPGKGGAASADRQVAHPDKGALLQLDRRRRTVPAALRHAAQLHAQLELVAALAHGQDPDARQIRAGR